MSSDQLEHAIRTACQIIEQRAVVVAGPQAILGTFTEDQLPPAGAWTRKTSASPSSAPSARRTRTSSPPSSTPDSSTPTSSRPASPRCGPSTDQTPSAGSPGSRPEAEAQPVRLSSATRPASRTRPRRRPVAAPAGGTHVMSHDIGIGAAGPGAAQGHQPRQVGGPQPRRLAGVP